MTDLIQHLRSPATTSVLAMCLLASLLEVAQGGMKGNKGGGSDIILYKDNLVIRGNGKGQGNLVIAGKQNHGHHEHHEHHTGEHHLPHHEDFHHGHHEFEHYGRKQSKEENLILAVLRDGNDKGKGGKGGGMGGMGGKGGKGGKGGNGGGNMVLASGSGNKDKGNGEMNWEQLILGGGRY